MTQYKDNFCITDDVHTISNANFEHIINFGDGKLYGIWKNEKPYAVIRVDRAWNPFDAACIFNNRLYIGNNDSLIIVDLNTLNCRTIECEMYFGYFYEYGELLFAASGIGVICFGENGEVKWQTERIAVDGVTFVTCDGERLEVSCCMEPCPATWCDKDISVATGEVLEVGELERLESKSI